jgi:hypothetical protein
MNALTELKLECTQCRRITVHVVDDTRTMCTVCGKLHHPERESLFSSSSIIPQHGGLAFKRAAVSPYSYLMEIRKGGA